MSIKVILHSRILYWVKYALENQQDVLFTIVSLKFTVYSNSKCHSWKKIGWIQPNAFQSKRTWITKNIPNVFNTKDIYCIFFRMFLSGFVVANDPRTSLPYFIFLNVYWVCLDTEYITSYIYINTLFLKYLMLRCFKCFLVDHNNNVRCTMILRIIELFKCKYHYYYLDHVCVPSDYIHLSIMMATWHFSLLVNGCGVLKGNDFCYSFLYD